MRALLAILITIICIQLPVCQAEPKLKVGIALPLTGLAASWGTAYKEGIQLALSDQPQSAELLNVIYEDHMYDNKQSLSAVRKLVNIDQVDLLAVWGFTPSDAIAPIAKELKVPVLLSSVNPVSHNRPNVINLTGPLNLLLHPLIEHVASSGYQKIALISTPVGVLEQGAQDMETELQKHKVHITKYSLPPDTTDFKSLIAKLKAAQQEALGLFLLPNQVKSFIEQARDLQFFPKFFGGNTFNDRLVIDLFKQDPNGPVFVDWFTEPEFQKRISNLPAAESHNVEVAQGYFLGSLLLKMAARSGSASAGAQILDELKSTSEGTSPAGSYRISNATDFGWHVIFPARLYQLSNGKLVTKNQ